MLDALGLKLEAGDECAQASPHLGELQKTGSALATINRNIAIHWRLGKGPIVCFQEFRLSSNFLVGD